MLAVGLAGPADVAKSESWSRMQSRQCDRASCFGLALLDTSKSDNVGRTDPSHDRRRRRVKAGCVADHISTAAGEQHLSLARLTSVEYRSGSIICPCINQYVRSLFINDRISRRQKRV
jgi:hypothetical protein